MIDYDIDNDGLIEIRHLEQLDALRHDRFGAGIHEELVNVEIYRSAYPRAESGMGCPFGICDGYELMRDLDFRARNSYASGSVNSKWIGGVGWLPIGIGEEKFSAKFNGNGYTITNLYISRDGLGDTGSAGLFGRTSESSEVSNVRLLDVDVLGNKSVGGLVGFSGGTVRAAYVSGAVSGIFGVGGLIGDSFGKIMDSSANVTVSGEDKIGGLSGTSVGLVADSFAMGKVSGQRLVGGLLGISGDSGMIVGSYFTGSVAGVSVLGGLAGRNDGEIMTSYSLGRVSSNTGDDQGAIGGLAGINYGSIISSYSVMQVRGIEQVGGLVGFNNGSIMSSYFAGSVSGLFLVGGLTASNNGIIRAAYTTGDVSGEGVVGGLSGGNSDEGVIITSYAVGRVIERRVGRDRVAALVGGNFEEGRIVDSYWDTQSTRQRRGVGEGSSSGAAGATTAQMQRPTGYTGVYSAWKVDIDNADGDFDPSTGRDDLWDFGTSSQYPALLVDFDGDGVATWQEFGDQRGN